MKRTNKTLFFKIIALTIAPIFLYQQIVWAQGGGTPHTTPIVNGNKSDVTCCGNVTDYDIDFPYSLARRDEIYTGVSEEKIIHLQDAHASLSAQYSLVNLLDVLAKDYDLEFIALEGTEGVIDTSLLKSFPDKDIREKTADLLMREGRMSAGEFFQITRDEKNIMLCGVEDNALYKENLDEFCRVIERREPLVKMVKAFRTQISALEEKVYSEELRVLLYKGRAHKNGTLSFSDYWRDIKPFLDKFKIETKTLRDVPLLTESIELERKIDFEKANSERTRLISDLTARLKKDAMEALVLESVNFKEQKISPAKFHKYLKNLVTENNISITDYKHFSMFTEYISLYESVDIFNLYSEVELLEKTIREKLYRNDDERELNEISVMMELLRGLYSIELSSRDFGFFRSYREKYNAKKFAAFLRNKCGEYNVSIGKGYDLSEMFGGINSAENFYETAARRDRLMIQNTLKRMKSEKKHVAALITGGYHTKGLTEIMKENRLSYLIISPKFEKDEERPYVAVLTGKKKPYQELIDTGKYQIMAAAWNDPNGNASVQALKDQEIALLSGGIAGLCGSGNWKKLVKDWKLDIDPDSDIQEVLDRLVIRRIGDIVLAGLGNVPMVALTKDKNGNPKRVKVKKKYWQIWNKRAGVVNGDLEKGRILLEPALKEELKIVQDDPFVLSKENIEKICKRVSGRTNSQRMYDDKGLLRIMKRILKSMGVSKKSLESEDAEKFMQAVINTIRQSGKKDETIIVKPVETVEDIANVEPEAGAYPTILNLSILQNKTQKESSKRRDEKGSSSIALLTLITFLCYMVLCHSPIPRSSCTGLSGAEWASEAGIGMILAKDGDAIELTPVQKFVKNTGLVIDLPQGARSIGTEDGVSSRPDEVEELFRNLTVPSVIVNLKIGSGDASGVEYSDDGTPLGLKNLQLAIDDMLSLINIAAKYNKKLTIMFHDDDITEMHSDVLEDAMKSMAMVSNVDCKLRDEVKKNAGENWDFVEYLGFLNNPDTTDVDDAYAKQFVTIGNVWMVGKIGKIGISSNTSVF